MAERKPLFMNADEGFAEQMARSDFIYLGGLILNPGGTGIDMNDQKISDMAEPTDPQDAATKAYVDAVASGLDVHASSRVKTVMGLGTQAVQAGAGGDADLLPMASETFTVKFHSPAGSAVLVEFGTEASMSAVAATINSAIQAVYGGTYAYAVVSGDGDNINLRDPYFGAHSKVDVTAISGVAVTNKIGISVDDTSGVGFTAAGSGVGKTLEAPDFSSDWNEIDGVTLVVNDRVLVTTEGGDDSIADVDNGIYKVLALGNDDDVKFKLERATDCDQASSTEFHQGTYTFVTEGTANMNTGWTCTTNVVTVDTTPNQWTQFSGAVSYTFDQGLKKVVSSVQVDLDDGADAQGAGAPTTARKSGLEFDADTAAGQLRVAVAAAGGLERYQDSPYGLGIKLNGATLNLSSSGIKVTDNTYSPYGHTHAHGDLTGVSADQHHNQSHVLTGTDHTESGLTAGYVLTALTASTFGWASPGASSEAPRVENTFDCTGGTVSKSDPVYLSADNKVDEGDCSTDAKSRIIGVARTAPSGNLVEVVTVGPCAGVLSGATVNTPYYLADGGGLTTNLPGIPGAHRVICVGYAINATDLFVEIKDFGKKAA